MKKIFSMVLVITLVLGFGGIQSFAVSIDDITFDNGTMFSVGLGINEEFTYTAKGLEGGSKVDISDPQNISWTTSNSSVVDFVGSTTGETVTVEAKSAGKAVITATYNGMSVESNVFTANGYSYDYVQNISMQVIGETTDNFTINIPFLNNFSLKDVFGSSYNDSGILKDEVTAMHALLYALEVYYDTEGLTDGWDWVSANVEVGYNGAFVSKIGADSNYGMTGWMYKIKPSGETNWELPMISASQYVLGNGDQEKWGFVTWGEEW